jgi:hypothetical protein
MASPKQFEAHATKHKYFNIETFGRDLQIKKQHFLSPGEEFFSRSKVFPYPISSCLENHHVFLGSLISSQHSGSSDILSKDEEQVVENEEIVEESSTDLMTLDLVETYHKVNSLYAIIT